MQPISGGALTSIHRTTPGFAEALNKVSEVKMNTHELVRRIDDSMEMGKVIMADKRADEFGGQEASDRVKSFYHGIKVLFEEVYGEGTLLSGTFETDEGDYPDMVEKGMAALVELRKMAIYSGEFGS
jgi:hypothetical protein